MNYKAQLVIRVHSKEDVATIQQLRAVAEVEGESFTQMVLSLIRAGIESKGFQNVEFEMPDPEPEAGEPETQSESEEVFSPTPEESSEVGAASLEGVSEISAMPETSEPESESVVAEKVSVEASCVDRKLLSSWAGGDVEKAVETVAELFEKATVLEGRDIRSELQEKLSESDYEELMSEVKRTDKYRAYRQRVIYGA